MIYGISILGNEARIVKVNGKKGVFNVQSIDTKLSLPKGDETIDALLDFQKNFEMLIQDEKPECVCLCEAGQESKKKRIRMEFSILCVCHLNSIPFKTYASSAVSKLINSGFEKTTGLSFLDEYEKLGLLKKDEKSFAVAWRFLD